MSSNVEDSSAQIMAVVDDSGMDLDQRATMIKVEDVSMTFNMASEQLNNLKEYMVSLVRGELRFKEFHALEHISFEVKKGDVFGILGTNGSGKSTLLKIIAGVLEPSNGTVQVNGNIAPLIELGAGFDMDLTARENIYLNGALLGYSKKLIDEHFDDIVDFAEIEDFLDIPIKNYSSGMMARIAFSIATVIVPDILLVDEVLSVGDFMFQKKCENRIRQLIDEHGVTVLIVSHSIDQVERLCNRAIWIEKGTCKKLGDAQKACRAYSALGGHTGSKESENRIIELIYKLDSEGSLPSIDPDYSANPYSVSCRLVRDSKGKDADTVVLASTASHINTIYANSIAGQYESAFVMPVTISDIPPDILHLLLEWQPKRIVFVGCGRESDEVIDKIRALPFDHDFLDLSGSGNIPQYSLELLENAIANDRPLGDSAILINFEDELEGLTLTPYIYEKKLPVIIARSSAGEGDIQPYLEALRKTPIKSVIVVGSALADDALLSQLEGFEVIRFADGDQAFKCCDAIAERFNSSEPASGNVLFITSLTPTQWMNYISMGSYLNATGDAFYPIDLTNLDSMLKGLDYIKSMNPAKLGIIGGEGEFSHLDRLLLRQQMV